MQSTGTWVSIVIDVDSTTKGEAKTRACGEGAVQDLGGAWTQSLALTQEHQHLALTTGTPIGGGHSDIWKERRNVAVCDCSLPKGSCQSLLSLF